MISSTLSTSDPPSTTSEMIDRPTSVARSYYGADHNNNQGRTITASLVEYKSSSSDLAIDEEIDLITKKLTISHLNDDPAILEENEYRLLLAFSQVEEKGGKLRNLIVHSLEKHNNLQDMTFFSFLKIKQTVVLNQTTMKTLPFLFVERVFGIARELFYENGNETKYGMLPLIIPESLQLPKKLNQLRNTIVDCLEMENQKQSFQNNNQVLVKNFINTNKFVSVDDCKTKVLKKFNNILRPHQKTILNEEPVGITNLGQFLHEVNTALFKVREEDTTDKKKKGVKWILQHSPNLFDLCCDIIEKEYNGKMIPDIHNMFKRKTYWLNLILEGGSGHDKVEEKQKMAGGKVEIVKVRETKKQTPVEKLRCDKRLVSISSDEVRKTAHGELAQKVTYDKAWNKEQ